MIEVQIANEQTAWPVDEDRLRAAVAAVLDEAHIRHATISVAVVDDPTMQKLNRQYLQHDYPTDVLSFLLERDADRVEGEIIVSADTAQAEARRLGWAYEGEILLYVIHGMLHMVGYDDATQSQRAAMRRRQGEHLARLGFPRPPEDESEDPAEDSSQ